MFLISFLFHLGMVFLLLLASIHGSPLVLPPSVYQVNLVSLPPAAVSAVPAQTEPPVEKAEIKEPVPPIKPTVVDKKPPVKPPPKPIEPVAVIPPKAKSKETAPSRGAAPSKEAPKVASPGPPLKDRAGELAAIPSIEAGIEAPDFKYPYYLDLIQRKIGMHWAPPPINTTSEIKETVVGFVLHSTGRIENVEIEKSSGNSFFDQAALRAIYQANPLPPLPQEIRDRSLKVHFSFSLLKKS